MESGSHQGRVCRQPWPRTQKLLQRQPCHPVSQQPPLGDTQVSPHVRSAQRAALTTGAAVRQAWTGEAELGDAVAALLQRLPRARWVATTLGAAGSLLVRRAAPEAATGARGDAPGAEPLGAVMGRLREQLAEARPGGGAPAVVGAGGVEVGCAPPVCARILEAHAGGSAAHGPSAPGPRAWCAQQDVPPVGVTFAVSSSPHIRCQRTQPAECLPDSLLAVLHCLAPVSRRNLGAF